MIEAAETAAAAAADMLVHLTLLLSVLGFLFRCQPKVSPVFSMAEMMYQTTRRARNKEEMWRHPQPLSLSLSLKTKTNIK